MDFFQIVKEKAGSLKLHNKKNSITVVPTNVAGNAYNKGFLYWLPMSLCTNSTACARKSTFSSTLVASSFVMLAPTLWE